MTKKRKKFNSLGAARQAYYKATDRIENLEEQLRECRVQLRKMTEQRDREHDLRVRFQDKNLTLLEDYHNLASDVLAEHQTRNMGHDGIKE